MNMTIAKENLTGGYPDTRNR